MQKDFKHNDFPSLAAVVHRMVLNAPSGLDARTIAEVSGYNYQTMMSELSRQQGHKLGADTLLPLMDACESNAPLVFLARERGGAFIPVPKPAENAGELVGQLTDSIKEFSEFAAETAQSIADGRLPKEQLDRIIKEGHEAMEAIMAMVNLARRTHEAQFGHLGQ